RPDEVVLPAGDFRAEFGGAGVRGDPVFDFVHAAFRDVQPGVAGLDRVGVGAAVAGGPEVGDAGGGDRVALDVRGVQHGVLPGGVAERRPEPSGGGADRRGGPVAAVLERDGAGDRAGGGVRG